MTISWINELQQWVLANHTLCLAGGMLVILLLLLQRSRVISRLNRALKEEKWMQTHLKNMVDNLPLIYMYFEVQKDEDGKVTDVVFERVNRVFIEQFYRLEECKNKSVARFLPQLAPYLLEAAKKTGQTGNIIRFPYHNPVKGTHYNVVVRPSKGGQCIEVFGMDCTELRLAQDALINVNKKLETALAAADVSPWRWELDNRTVYCQKILSDADGETSQRDLALTEDKMFSHISRADRERICRVANELITGKIKVAEAEYRTSILVNGKLQTDWIEVRATVGARNQDGRPLALVGSRQVITHRKRMEEELVKARMHAEESNRLKSAFLANMSHEIRTPLNAIVGFSELLANTENKEERNEYEQIIKRNSELLLQLVSDILDLSKIEAGTMEFAESDFDLNQLMADMYSIFCKHLPADKSVALSYTPGMEKCVIRSERNRLTQLLTNLLTNAVKFTEKGSIRFGYEREGDFLHFRVKDTGCGIAKEKQKDIFNRFVKLNSFKQGTGLGLSICKCIVDTLGGEIGVDSEPGQGSLFHFTIPYKPVEKDLHSQTAPNRQAETPIPERACILVAEDNESNYKLLTAILSKKYKLMHAWNGREAVEMFRKSRPQLILMDINMPEMNGYEATCEIRKLSADVPILALTAYAYASDEERILKCGMNEYMSKPVNMQQLQSRVAALIQGHVADETRTLGNREKEMSE